MSEVLKGAILLKQPGREDPVLEALKSRCEQLQNQLDEAEYKLGSAGALAQVATRALAAICLAVSTDGGVRVYINEESLIGAEDKEVQICTAEEGGLFIKVTPAENTLTELEN